MMRTVDVKLKENPYRIYVGRNAAGRLADLLRKMPLGRDAVLITTPHVKKLCGSRVLRPLEKACRSVLVLTVPDSEKSKNAGLAFRLIEKISRFDVKKNLFVVALGGGVTGDLSGFIAAIYKRGVPYIQIPTTLLAQIDSSIGGKTAVDTAFGKNLVGTFYQPRFVLADIGFLKTLPEDEMRAGLAEAVKYAVIKDAGLFDFLRLNFQKVLARDPRALLHLIGRCAAIKARVVAADEFDKKGIRMILNFGHTFAHALEAASHFRLSHGKAVSLGMVYACRLSEKLGLAPTQETARVTNLLGSIGLPTRIKGVARSAVLKAMAHDKKFSKGTNRFVLMERIGKTKIVENVPAELVKEAVG